MALYPRRPIYFVPSFPANSTIAPCDLGEAQRVRVNRIVVCRVQFQQLDVDPCLLQPSDKGFRFDPGNTIFSTGPMNDQEGRR
jgi:hypothetical protein